MIRRVPTLAVLLFFALAIRCLVPIPGLNYDEAQSVTFASRPVPDLLHVVASADPHPPLYYLQLHAWPGLYWGDFAVRMNSIAWSLLALALFWLGTRRLFGPERANLSTVLFALAPLAVHYAVSVRMYAMLTALAGFCWLGIALLETARDRRDILMGTALVFLGAAGAAWTQGAGFLLGGAVLAYYFLRAISGTRIDRVTVLGLLANTAALASAAPWLLKARELSVGHLATPTPWIVANTLKELLFGISAWPPAAVLAGAAASVLLLIAVLRAGWHAWLMVLAFLVAPLAAMLALSIAYRPLWDTRTVAWLTPFLCIAAAFIAYPARTEDRAGHRPLRWLLILLLVAGAVHGLLHPYRPEYGYRQITATLATRAQPGDLVYAPRRDFWAVAWYAGAARAVTPLAFQELPVPFRLSNQPDTALPGAGNVWVLYRDKHARDSADMEKRLTQARFSKGKSERFGQLHLVPYTAPRP
jgi:mannosyltransferase